MKTSIIILTCNNFMYSKMCIDSIRKYTRKNDYEIIVVDNNSQDGTKSWLRKQKDIKTIYNKVNEGFPKGCNVGIKKASGSEILLLNNDVIVTSNWLLNLKKCLYSDNKIGAVGPVTNTCYGKQKIFVKYNSLYEMQRFAKKYNVSNSNRWVKTRGLVGFCILIKMKVINNLGYLDERFTPGNFEDDDYCLRMVRKGYKLMICKDTFVHHYGSISFKNTEYSKIINANRIKFERKWGMKLQ
ncbi:MULTISPECIES: glycosyltransferase family 2 protein [Clostridium]|uniref:glycosyltransferase family 2 protein n=1 Tax=Clostridium TaxID=1485 RepID=UPI0008266FDE|nr:MULTISPECIES: glycosyltransferase family 2 protein [Clostridium]PJI09696.1 glycosyltransferase family 2 protein [Clostridium sp. CT7]